jgi:hypothetical protein
MVTCLYLLNPRSSTSIPTPHYREKIFTCDLYRRSDIGQREQSHIRLEFLGQVWQFRGIGGEGLVGNKLENSKEYRVFNGENE